MDELENGQVRRGRRRGLRLALVILLAALAIGLGLAWLMRYDLATGYVEREFDRRGVQASYQITRIGFGSQILENLVIGDPARPDLTARRVEIRLRLGFDGLTPGLITARGVRLRGTVRDGRLSFGQVDRLLPPPSDAPFRLPDQRIDVADAAILLDTPAGQVALGLAGRGNLADGFRGSLAIASDGLRLGGCVLDRPRFDLAVAIDDLSPRFRGPAAMASLRCGDTLAIERPLFAFDARLAPALDSWRGGSAVRFGPLRVGAQRLNGVEGRLSFAGNRAQTRGAVALRSGAAAVAMLEAGFARFDGNYALSLDTGALVLDGDVAARGLAVEAGTLTEFAGSLRSLADTPLGPIGGRLAEALIRVGRGGAQARARIHLESRDGSGQVRIAGLRLDSRSGARLAVEGGEGLVVGWPGGATRLNGVLALSGGGFPDMRLRLARVAPDGGLAGSARIAPIAADGARLALGEIRFEAIPGGNTRFATTISIDGPFQGGRVDGLTLPLRGRFGRSGFALGETCVNASVAAIRVQNLHLGRTVLSLCPSERALVLRAPGGPLQGGAELRAPRLAGRLGSSPIALAADRLRVGLEGLAASAVTVRLGLPSAPSRFAIASLDGRFGSGGVAGDFAGLSVDLAAVPLLVDQGRGRWQFASGRLNASGHVRVSDKQEPARFQPLVSDDFALAIAGNDLEARGWLAHPASGTRIVEARIDHDLGSGAGNARLDMPGIAFGENFQPEALTPLTVGVVALVEGTLRGEGRIEWDANGTRSTGIFSTQDMNLAAPFGPVEGLTTTIRFTDLLGLASAPGQEARIDLIRAGVDVHDGIVRYQLLPDYRVAIESARWPFAGGTLDLEPALLDFSRETSKYLTFRVTALDAARFIEQMEFSNFAATGTFDGIIPMQFDEQGAGRIAGGRLQAREQGGTLSYVGELSDRDLGAYGILAFNALKSLRYNRFALTLDGALDGEFITVIDLDGIARDPAGTTLPSGGISGMVAGRVFRELAQIPFEFNITIQGQFRALIATARSFNDPTPLIQSVLPQQLRERAATINTVQDEESEPVQ